jgi:predicted RNA-binding Zn-ribbon protein involved in translation (DUF1610 family)/DNA primase
MKLTQKQLENVLASFSPVLDARKRNLLAHCPQCGEFEFGISLYERLHPYQCYRRKKCGFIGNIYTLLAFLGKSREFAKDEKIDLSQKLRRIEGKKKAAPIVIELPEVSPPVMWQRVYEDEYLRKRYFEDYQFEKFEVGRSILKKDYVTFLVRQHGVVTGYIGRSDRSKEWIDDYNARKKQEAEENGERFRKYLRYDNSKSDFSKMLFGLDEIITGVTTDVILVEGIFSKTRTDSNLELDFQDEFKCCATFGAKISPEQIALLKQKQVKNIHLWFEADVLNKAKAVAAELSLHFRNVRASFLKGKDPGEINAEESFQLLENSFDWLEFNTNFVAQKLL